MTIETLCWLFACLVGIVWLLAHALGSSLPVGPTREADEEEEPDAMPRKGRGR